MMAACAALPPASIAPPGAQDAAFTLDGRLSARRGDQGVAGAFTWIHRPGRDAIDLASPLGQTLAEIDGDADGVRLRLPDGKTDTAPDWATLTERAFGVVIPVEGLAFWVRGEPRAGGTARIERDARGRVVTLRQDGWEIAYAYADDSASRPDRVTLRYPEAPPIDVRVVVDRWQ
ncbi:MAG: lipoprotein insertase outer membrane protein LolB [Candidatus Levyibacteriota bacterium]